MIVKCDIIEVMKKIIVGLLVLMSVGSVRAQDRYPSPVQMESQSYSYVVKEDGNAQVWLRVDGVMTPKTGGEYRLGLPEKTEGEVKGWYRENGCPEYISSVCNWRFGNVWREAKVKVENGELILTIPQRKVAKPDEGMAITLGISFGVSDVTTKRWWGREVSIATGKASGVVSYMSIGAYLPEGVYVRDSQQGPSGWGQAIGEMVSGGRRASGELGVAKMMAPTLLDMAGGGEIVRSRSNLLPGEDYSFTFKSATSVWKLYVKEMVWGVTWIVAIAVVLALLLRLMIGRKPVWWYLSVMGLLMLLLILTLGLWIGYRFSMGGGSYPPGPVYQLMKGGVSDAPVSE